jgi:hypothetical protein
MCPVEGFNLLHMLLFFAGAIKHHFQHSTGIISYDWGEGIKPTFSDWRAWSISNQWKLVGRNSLLTLHGGMGLWTKVLWILWHVVRCLYNPWQHYVTLPLFTSRWTLDDNCMSSDNFFRIKVSRSGERVEFGVSLWAQVLLGNQSIEIGQLHLWQISWPVCGSGLVFVVYTDICPDVIAGQRKDRLQVKDATKGARSSWEKESEKCLARQPTAGCKNWGTEQQFSSAPPVPSAPLPPDAWLKHGGSWSRTGHPCRMQSNNWKWKTCTDEKLIL